MTGSKWEMLNGKYDHRDVTEGLEPGSKVDVLRENVVSVKGSKFFAAEIMEPNEHTKDGNYRVRYTREVKYTEIKEGDKVTGNWHGKWYDATVEVARDDGTYQIRWTNDNKVTPNFPRTLLRSLEPKLSRQYTARIPDGTCFSNVYNLRKLYNGTNKVMVRFLNRCKDKCYHSKITDVKTKEPTCSVPECDGPRGRCSNQEWGTGHTKKEDCEAECSGCHGKGKNEAGNTCEECDGTGNSNCEWQPDRCGKPGKCSEGNEEHTSQVDCDEAYGNGNYCNWVTHRGRYRDAGRCRHCNGEWLESRPREQVVCLCKAVQVCDRCRQPTQGDKSVKCHRGCNAPMRCIECDGSGRKIFDMVEKKDITPYIEDNVSPDRIDAMPDWLKRAVGHTYRKPNFSKWRNMRDAKWDFEMRRYYQKRNEDGSTNCILNLYDTSYFFYRASDQENGRALFDMNRHIMGRENSHWLWE